MAFHKTTAPVAKGRAIKSEVPDNEDAYGVDEEPADDADDDAEGQADLDPAKDALLRPAKRSKAPSAGARSRATQ